MGSVLLVAGAALAYIIAYNTYGKFLARKLFQLNPNARTPAVEVDDGVDFVPATRGMLFGHHYTSIAGTGPIVGPAIGIIWGWLPALLWVTLGCIFMGAVHDLSSLVISMRNQGRSIGDIAGDIISPRVRVMFLCIIALCLLIVLAIFCLVIATLFKMYPGSVFSVWIQIPIALWLGYMIYSRRKPALRYSLVALVLLGAAVYVGAQYVQVTLPPFSIGGCTVGPVVSWSILLLVYVFFASVTPVQRLLQPRDYINSHVLFVIMMLMALGVLFSRPELVAPAVDFSPEGAPAIWPFLFITIACGAISGFHSLVSSGTTAKQIANEMDACPIAYGGMLMEGMLAVFVIVAVAAGIGLLPDDAGLSGAARWHEHYANWGAAKGLDDKVGAFVAGAANMLSFIGIPLVLGSTVMGVFVACFAGTTLDTATRLQRYVIAELGNGLKVRPLTNKYVATSVAVISAGLLALWDGQGKGGLILWPLFGAANQLLGALALLVITVYLAHRRKPLLFTLIPFLLMLVMTGWAIVCKVTEFYRAYVDQGESLHLLIITGVIAFLEAWMVVEAATALVRSRRKAQPAQA